MATEREFPFSGEFHFGNLHVSFQPKGTRSPSAEELSLEELKARRDQVLDILRELSEEIKRREA